MTALSLEGIVKTYGDRRVLDGVDLQVDPGDVVAIIGPSGVGKSTLLKVANGLVLPDDGKVSVLGKRLTHDPTIDLEAKRSMACILQKPVAFRTTVQENVAYGLKLRDVDEEEVDRRVDEALEAVGLAKLADRFATTLSGGEMQRMAFARATIFEPTILLLDEFTANLDPSNVNLLESSVLEYARERDATVVIVTHNLFQARRISRSAAFLLDGTIVETGPTKGLFEDPEDEATRAFVSGEMVF